MQKNMWKRLTRKLRPTIGLIVESLDSGGLEQVVVNLHKGLSSEGFRSIIIVSGSQLGPVAAQVDPSNVVVCGGKKWKLFFWLLALRIGTAHFHYSAFGLKICKILGIRTVYTIHGCYTWLDDHAFKARSSVICRFDQVVAVSRSVRDYFVARHTSELDVKVIGNGIDVQNWKSIKLDAQKAGKTFLSLASVQPLKNQMACVFALEQVLAFMPDTKLFIMGKVLDRRYLDSIQYEVQSRKLRSSVIFGELVGQQEIQTFLDLHEPCLLLPSLQEGSSNVLLEFACVDLPIIATEVGSATEVAEIYQKVCLIPAPIVDLTKFNLATLEKTENYSSDPLILSTAQHLAKAMKAVPKNPLLTNYSTSNSAVREAASMERMTKAYLEIY
jgi:glycosyltransferase involved in cell wall biosynthesis